MAETNELTPLMKQYWDLKSQVPDALLLFRMGDFYELFGDDAITASKILEITLTSRDKNKETPLAMAGVPYHSIQGYIQKLLDHGKKIAIGEQVEDAEEAKKRGGYKAIVRREITRILTPAVQFESEGSQTSYLATAIQVNEKGQPSRYTLAVVDASTGETRVSLPLEEKVLLEEVIALPIRHFLRIGHTLPAEVALQLRDDEKVLFEEIPANRVSLESAQKLILGQYESASLEPFLESGSDLDSATIAVGHLLSYLQKTQRTEILPHLRTPTPLRTNRGMKLGPRTVKHLDLLSNAETGTSASLFYRINSTKSALGARQLKRWLLEPLRTVNEIEIRQNAVKELASDTTSTEKLRQALGSLYDLERILARTHTGLASPRDTRALGLSLSLLPQLLSMLSRFQTPLVIQYREKLREACEQTLELSKRILKTQKETAPLVVRDGGIFEKGTHPELDRLIDLTENGQRWLIDLEQREREATGINSLKVRYNRVFGYYIEITTAHLKNAPAHYQRKQTTVGGERFFTDELKKFEDEIVSAEDRKKALEKQLFDELLEAIRAHTKPISVAAQVLAELDATLSLAVLAWERGWVFPLIDASSDLEIELGRHPTVDQGRGDFIPNTLKLNRSSALGLIITGPNMGGKSTLLRQTALIVILGQMGAPVPAQAARWGSVSSIYTRIGAHDAIARGQSTFMVEMTELAHILHHADERSLIVLDEIGRGTSTYDGISVAWAMFEWIMTRISARTLFATHYHELTKLDKLLPFTANAHLSVDSSKNKLKFLYELKSGPANESFGIQVAKLAGLPAPVIQKAWKVLEELENANSGSQLSLFDSSTNVPVSEEILEPTPELPGLTVSPSKIEEEISKLNLNEMTPMDALLKLSALQKELSL